jgi:hypothetical protein
MTIDAQSPGSFNVDGKILNRGIFTSGHSIPGEFPPNRRIGLTGNRHHDQRGEERNTRRIGQLNLFLRPISPEKIYSNGIFLSGVVACDKREAFASESQRDARMRAR